MARDCWPPLEFGYSGCSERLLEDFEQGRAVVYLHLEDHFGCCEAWTVLGTRVDVGRAVRAVDSVNIF